MAFVQDGVTGVICLEKVYRLTNALNPVTVADMCGPKTPAATVPLVVCLLPSHRIRSS
jgi:hypothetical protein